MSSKEIEKALYHFFGQYDIQINPTKKETFKYKTKVDTKNKKTLKKGGQNSSSNNNNDNDIISYPEFCNQQEVKEIEQFVKKVVKNKYDIKNMNIQIISDQNKTLLK